MGNMKDVRVKAVRLILLCLWTFNQVDTATIKFYDKTDFDGFFYESNVDHEDGCINLPQDHNETSSIDTGGACVILYERVNCQGRRLKVSPGVHSHNNLEKHDFNNKTSSFIVCSLEETEKEVKNPQFSLFDNIDQNSLLVEYKDVCHCTNLPAVANKKLSSVNTHGNCLRLYSDKDCYGEMRELQVNSSVDLTSLGFNDRASSIDVCGFLASCTRLYAVISKFIFTSNLVELLKNRTFRKIELASPHTFKNNASTPISRIYAGKRNYREMYQFEQVDSLKHMNSVAVDHSISVDGDASISFLAKDKVQHELDVAYQFQTTLVSETGSRYTSKESREFSVSEKLTVPPCTELEVRSFIVITEKLPVNYELLVRVSGENHGKAMTSDEVKNSLPHGMTYLETKNDTQVWAKAKGRLLASIGIKAEVENRERKIQGCQERKRRRRHFKQ